MTISRLRVAAKPNANANHPTPPPTVNKARLQGCDSTQGGLNNSTTEKLGHRARAWDTRTPRHRFQCRLLFCACFVSFRGSRTVSRDVHWSVEQLVWRRVEPCESGRRVVACLEPGPRAGRDTHLTSQLLRVAHVSHSHTTHACTPPHTPFVFSLFLFCARALTSLSPSSSFFSDDGQRQGHTCGEREREREREMGIHIL